MMTKEEYLRLAEAEYVRIEKLAEHTNFYDYEKAFDEVWVELGRKVLESSIGAVPRNHQKKISYGRGTEK
jgi:hypothetical protein